MSSRFTFLALIFLALVASVYFLDSTPKPPPRRVGLPGANAVRTTVSQPTPLVPEAPDKVRRLVFYWQGERKETSKRNGQWSNTDQPGLVTDLVHDLGSLGALERIHINEEQLADFGLAVPKGRLELYVEGKKEPVIIEFGNLNPPGTGVYLRMPPESAVLLAGSLLNWSFQRTFRALTSSNRTASP